MYNNLAIQLVAKENFNCFQYLTGLNMSDINICVQVFRDFFGRNKFSCNLGKYIGMQLLGHKTVLNFVGKY